MSASFPGVPPAPPPPEPLLAAAVVLHRDGPDGREVLLVRRGTERRFAGGFHAFPGGRLDPEDAEVAVTGATGEAAALVACAVRELFEETGVLLAAGAGRLTPERRRQARAALLDGASFAAFVKESGIGLSAALLAPAGRWITPEHLPLRYDARLFLAPLPAGERAEIWPGELSGGDFVPAARALGRWRKGELLLFPPNLHAVREVAREGGPSLAELERPPVRARRIEFQGGVLLAALRTPTLPPATHTNAWILAAGDGVAVIDPGAPEPSEQARLFELLDAEAAEGRPPRAVYLTHVHPDHVGAARAVAERYGVPVRAHALAAGRVPGVRVEPVREGELLGGRYLVLETPGHAREHLAFLDEESGALFCGDLVSTLSTIVVDPPEGDMSEYVRQLERMRALAPRTLYPAHGPPAPDAVSRLGAYLSHRREREGLILGALAQGGTLEEVTARAYADTPALLHPVAARSCLATLEKLRREGRAREADGRWSSAG